MFSLSNDIESTVASRSKQGGWRGLAGQWNTVLPFRRNGGSAVRFGMELDRPPADDRRRGESSCSGSTDVGALGDTFFGLVKMEQFEKNMAP